jgi:spore maturation protein CgeB
MVRYAEGSIANRETTAWHRSAAISLNLHRRMTYVEHPDQLVAPGAAESLGPRAYEIPAVGGFMLSDDERPELADVYGASAATFRAWDSADLERQIRYWLAHPDERERRRAAQREAVQPHTWAARARVVLETLFA